MGNIFIQANRCFSKKEWNKVKKIKNIIIKMCDIQIFNKNYFHSQIEVET